MTALRRVVDVEGGLAAMAYHLMVLSFAEECVLALQNADAMGGDARADASAPIELAGG